MQNHNIFEIPNYKSVVKHRNLTPEIKTGGGVAIYIHESITYTEGIIHPEVEGVYIDIGGFKIYNIYNAHANRLDIKIFERVFKNANFICGDLNLHHYLWGGSTSTILSRKFVEKLQQNDFICLNDGSHTYFTITGYSSPLDITFVKANKSNKVEWFQTGVACGSNHTIIITKINHHLIEVSDNIVGNWNYNKANWLKFAWKCEQTINETIVDEDIEVFHNNIIKCITEAADKCIPKVKLFNKKPKPWWSENCLIAIKNRNKAYNKARKTQDLQDFIKYKKCQAKLKYTIKLAKSVYWDKLCQDLNSMGTRGLWDQVNKISNSKNKRSVPVIKENDEFVKDPEQIANIFADKFENDYNNVEQTRLNNRAKTSAKITGYIEDIINNDNNLPINDDITFHEVKEAIKNANNTSPGEDKIKTILYKHVPEKSLEIITKLFNIILTKGELPKLWKQTIIVPIPKPGKNPNSKNSYRPIALTSTLCKIMERILNDRMIWFLNKNRSLNKYQCGFTKNRGTMDHIVRLADSIYKTLEAKQYTVGIFIDLEKAYDLLWHEGLIFKLAKLGISGKMLRWIKDFLTDRSFKIKIGQKFSEIKIIQNGTPQGSVVSPLFFNIMVNDIPIDNEINLSLYADDVAMWISGADLKEIRLKMQNYLDKVVNWANDWSFSISLAKTNSITFTTRMNTPQNQFKLNQSVIQDKASVKFLGIIFDRALKLNEQVEHVTVRLNNSLNLLNKLAVPRWGCNKKVLVNIYKALIRSVIDYAGFLYLKMTATNKQLLDKIQGKALRIICGAMKTAPLAIVQADTGDPPLSFTWRKIIIIYGLRVLQFKNHPCYQIFADEQTYFGKFVATFLQEQETKVQQSYDLPIPSWQLNKPKIDIGLAEIINKNQAPEINLVYTLEYTQKWGNMTQFFTDGSKINDKVGFGLCVKKSEIMWIERLNDKLSIFTAELAAINKALQFIRDRKIMYAVIFTDSLSALQSLQSSNSRARQHLINSILVEIHYLIKRGQKIDLVWVPSHIGFKGNEIADSFAKLSCKKEAKNNMYLHSPEELKHILNRNMVKAWNHYWNQDPVGRFYKVMVPKVSMELRHYCNSRSAEVMFFKFVSNFNLCKANQYKFHKINNNLCNVCNIEENVHHIIMTCNKYAQQRSLLMKQLKDIKVPFQYEIIFTHKEAERYVWQFIKSCKIHI